MSNRIAVLGGGVMGEILAGGFLRYLEPRPTVVVAEKRTERADELAAALGVEIAEPAAAVDGVKSAVPSARVIPRILATTPASTSASPVPPSSTDIVDTKTSRARKLLTTPTVNCQSKPSGANAG